MDKQTKECLQIISQMLVDIIAMGYNFYGEGWVDKHFREINKLNDLIKKPTFDPNEKFSE